METPNQHQSKWREWIPALIVFSPAIYTIATDNYREYILKQKRESIDKLSSKQLADEIRIFQSGIAYSVEREKEKAKDQNRYPPDYVSVDYSHFYGISFADFTRYGTGMQGVSLVDRDADGFVDLEIILRRFILSNDDQATCFRNLSECNDPKLEDRITRRTKQSPEFAGAQAQYETGLRTFLKNRYTK